MQRRWLVPVELERQQERLVLDPRDRLPLGAPVLAIVGGIWEVYARVADALLIPTFSETVLGVVQLAIDPTTWQAFWLSNQSLIVGFAIAVLLGIFLGLAAARFRSIHWNRSTRIAFSDLKRSYS